MRGRKGQIQDLVLIPVIIFVLAIVLFFALKVVKNVGATDAIESSATASGILSNQEHMLKGYDSMNVFFVVVLFLIMAGLAYFVRSSPIGIAILIFLGLSILVVSAILSNSYNTIATSDAIIEEANEFGKTNSIFENLPIILTVGFFVLLIFLFGKPQFNG